MSMFIRRDVLQAITSLSLLICAISIAHAATGARIVVQAFDPLHPDRSGDEVLVDHPTLVSDMLQLAWTQARPKICQQLKLKMGLGGAVAGETLRDIDCLLDEEVGLEVTAAGWNSLRVRLAVSGYIEATSTTPDPIPPELDPRISISLTAKLDLNVAIQQDRNQTLRVSRAQFTLNNATLNSQNFSGDVFMFVAEDMLPFLGGENYKALVESAINAVSENIAADFNSELASVNTLLKGPSNLVRVGASGAGNYISVAFAPHAIEPPTNGSVTGLVRWDPAEFTPRNGCQSFDIHAVVQTGPAPLYARDPTPPTRRMGVYQAEQTGVGSCTFTLSKIADGWPNALSSTVLDPPIKKAGNSNTSETYSILKDGWNEPTVIPQPILGARNYIVHAHTLKMGYQTKLGTDERTFLEKEYRTNPRFNPERSTLGATTQPDVKALTPRVSRSAGPQIEAVRLNPQPLQPDPDPQPDPVEPTRAMEALAEPASSPTAIIIVGGKPAYPHVKRATPAQKIDGDVVQPQR